MEMSALRNRNEDYHIMIQNKMHEFKYYIRDEFLYSEIKDLRTYCDDIMKDKEEGGYIDD